MHNLEMRNGSASMFFNARYGNPWHDLGTAVDGAATAAQALELSRQDWEVIKRQLHTFNAIGDSVALPIYGIFRDDNGAFLGSCGEGYEPIQNISQFEVIDSLLSSSDGAHYDTAGVLGRGERVWTLARIPEADFAVAGNDRHLAFLLACTSHDGSLAFTLKLCHTRVVCQNTLTAALNSNGALAKVKHTKTAGAKIDAARKYFQSINASTKSLSDKLAILANRKMTRETYQAAMDRLFPVAKDESGQVKESTRRDNILSEIVEMYQSNDRNQFPEFKGTAYNLLNAVTEYTDHLRTARISDDKADTGYTMGKARAESSIFGSGDSLKSKALEIILETTDGNPVVKQVQVSLNDVLAAHPSVN